jgi:hypothetical protein
MRYFTVQYDYVLPYCIQLRDFLDSTSHKVFYKEEADTLNHITTLYVQGKEDHVYPDFFQTPVYMVSEKIKNILELYDEELIFKTVLLTNLEAKTQELYYHMVTDHIEGLSDQTTFHKNGLENKIVLDFEKVKDQRVFQLKDSKKHNLFMRLDVVESLLRRNVIGLIFEEVEVK